jgi:glycine/D-amino acid oxidase-like deaminating enzyme
MKDVIGLPDCYSKAGEKTKLFGKTFGVIKNRYEGQLDTGFMMKNLLTLAQKKGIDLLNNIHVENITDLGHRVELVTKQGNFTASKAVVATNGFAARLLNIQDVLPARAQVLITKPIPQLKIKGTFHYEQGYYYFRNIDNRILLGGGRNLDVKGETTFEQGLTPLIQEELDRLLREMVLPGVSFEVEHRWSGIMGVGSEKKPIVKNVSQNVMAAVRMGGMGVAIGSWVGEKAAKEIL